MVPNKERRNMELSERIERLDRHIENGTLCRGAWDTEEGEVCMLGAIAPEVLVFGSVLRTRRVPAEVMPWWLADLVPVINDYGSPLRFETVCRRFSAIMRRTPALTPALWDRVEHANLVTMFEVLMHESQLPREQRLILEDVCDHLRGAATTRPPAQIWERFEAAETEFKDVKDSTVSKRLWALCRRTRGGDKSEARYRLRRELDFWRPTAGYATMIDQLTDELFNSLEEACDAAEGRG